MQRNSKDFSVFFWKANEDYYYRQPRFPLYPDTLRQLIPIVRDAQDDIGMLVSIGFRKQKVCSSALGIIPIPQHQNLLLLNLLAFYHSECIEDREAATK